MSNIGSYEQRLEGFDWAVARAELDWQDDDILNIGWICSDRVCKRGHADKTALIWEGFGDKKATYSFDDLRVWSPEAWEAFKADTRAEFGAGIDDLLGHRRLGPEGLVDRETA